MGVVITYQGGDGVVTLTPSAGYFCGFFGELFGYSIGLSEYQDSTYATNVTGTANSGSLPNVKYTGSGTAEVAGSDVAVGAVANTQCTLKLTFSSGSAFYLQTARFVAYDGVSEAVAPSGSVIYGFESGDSAWTLLSGSNSALWLTPETVTPQTSYDRYVSLSAAPTVVGASNTIKFSVYAEYY